MTSKLFEDERARCVQLSQKLEITQAKLALTETNLAISQGKLTTAEERIATLVKKLNNFKQNEGATQQQPIGKSYTRFFYKKPREGPGSKNILF